MTVIKYVEYIVVILNYNTANDALLAAESVNKTAGKRTYHICIADNGSSKKGEKEILQNADIENTTIIQLDKNYGYAVGNNKAVEEIKKSYQGNYIVIMNPDVCIEKNNTIDGLLDRIESSSDCVVGVQPLVHTVMWKEVANRQINIRRVPQSTSEILVYVNLFARKVFYKTRARINYEKERPYNRDIKYEVPSGAFFIMKSREFELINGFDKNTFMYCEEIIIGKKIKDLGKSFLLVPEYQVEHYHGKSTGSHNGKVSDFTKKELIKSWDYYATYYLHLSVFERYLIKKAIKIDCSMRNMMWRRKK